MAKYYFRLLLCLCLCWPIESRAEDAVIAVAVMPFAKLKGDKAVWLDNAIGDIVAQKLAESDRYGVLNRDALQTFLKEMQLEQSGFVDNTQALQRVGKVTKVRQLVFGSYELSGSSITIHSAVMEVDSQTIRSRKDVSGDVKNLITLCGQLVDALLASQNIMLSPKEQANIAFTPTDSISALKHFYNGVHAYDQGQYETAMGDFYAARKQDPAYLDASLWFARMLEQLGRDDEAVSAYLDLAGKYPNSIEGIDARYFAGRLQAKSRPQEAIKTYQLVADIRPEIPETLEAAYQAALLARAQNMLEESYTLYKQLDDFGARVRAHDAAFTQAWERQQEEKYKNDQTFWQRLSGTSGMPKFESPPAPRISAMSDPTRHSRFFGWNHALGLYREAITAMVELYSDLPPDAKGKPRFPPPRGSFLVDPENPVIRGDVKDREQSLFAGDHTYYPHWKESFYALIIPKGYEATGTELQLTGSLPEATPTRDFTLRVMPFPLTQNYHNSWLGVIFGQTPTTATLKKETPFFGDNQHLLALQLLENYGIIDGWQVKLHLRKEVPEPPIAQTPQDANMEGALLAKVRLGSSDSRTVQTLPQYIMELQPRQKLAMAEDKTGTLWLVGVKGELYAQNTDLWMTHSTDGGRNWTPAGPMPVNSASQDFAPTLVHAEDGSLQLFFLSDRRGLGWEIWTSRQDPVSKNWSHPALLPVHDVVAGFEKDNDISAGLLPYAVTQDDKGQWLVAVYSGVYRQLAFIASDDAIQWHLLSTRTFDTIGSLGLGQDAAGRYYLVTISPTDDLAVYYSNDAKSWERNGGRDNKYDDERAIATYPVTLFKRPGEGMELLFSDVYAGLQYTGLSPAAKPMPDLVTQSGLEPYAAAATKKGVIAALWKDDDIYIQRYQRFALPENGVNRPDNIIYIERSHDKDHGLWERIIARDRFRVPDVTAVGTSPGGRAWWGMETGAMSLQGGNFFFSDVSLGFFSHDVDRILYCGETTWFTSRDMQRPEVGYSTGDSPSIFTTGRPLLFNDLSGPVSAIACGQHGETYFGTGNGEVLVSPQEGERHVHKLPKEDKNPVISALAFNSHSKQLLAATQAGELYGMDEKGFFKRLAHFAHPLLAVAADKDGRLWVAVKSEGIILCDGQGKVVKRFGAAVVPANIGKLVADKTSGVWAIAASDSLSPGLMHVTSGGVKLVNPPQEILRAIIDFSIADDGSIWIGTNLRGIYHYHEAH